MEGIEKHKNFQANNTLNYGPDSNQLRAERNSFISSAIHVLWNTEH